MRRMLLVSVFYFICCVIVTYGSTCDQPAFPYGSTILHPSNQEKYQHGSVILFGCKQGFYLAGPPIIKCIGSKWTQIQFRCLGFCPEVRNILNGKVIHVTPKVGKAAVEFRCDRKFRLVGWTRLECINGRWNGMFPYCEKLRSCSRLQSPANGTLHGSDTSHGAKANFACFTGFDLFGSTTLTCNNGVWSSSAPTCKAYCIKIRDPPNGHVFGTRFSHGRVVSFKCKLGYELVGDRTLRCINGRWNSSVPQCKVMLCSKPSISSNAYIFYPGPNQVSYTHGTVLYLACRDGFFLMGWPMMTCNQTAWVKKEFSCVASCPTVGSVTNGVITHVTLKNGGEVKIKCHANYTLVGSSRLRCINGRWNDSLPSCKAACVDPGFIDGGKRNGNDFSHGRVVSYKCTAPNNILVGNSRLTCNDGNWDSPRPVCKKSCPPIPPLSNGQIHNNSISYGALVSFSCDEGFQLKGLRQVKCLDGKWNGGFPSCKGMCSVPRPPDNGKIIGNDYSYGALIKFQCDPGYNVRGSASLTCKKGEWKGQFPECKKRCQDPGNPMKGSIIGNNFSHGGAVRFICKDGPFDLIGASEITCSDGAWSHPKPSCEARCSDPGAPVNGAKDGDDYRSRASVTFRCNPPLKLIGSRVILCQDGRWNNSRPTCSDCRRPLGLESKKNNAIRITSTRSYIGRNYGPSSARLNGPYAWCTRSNSGYLLINLGKTYKLTAIATQGGTHFKRWVKKYRITFKSGGTTVHYSESGSMKDIEGNKDASTIAKYTFKEPFITDTIWIQVLPIDTDHVCLRTELYGCDPTSGCILVGSMFWGLWAYNRNALNYYRAYITKVNATHFDFALQTYNKQTRSYRRTDQVLIVDQTPKINEISPNSSVIANQFIKYKNWFRTGTAIRTSRNSMVIVKFDDGETKGVPLERVRLVSRPRFCSDVK